MSFLLYPGLVVSVSHAESKKVYTVKAEQLIGWAQDKGHLTNIKKLDNSSSCKVSKNIMKVNYNTAVDQKIESDAACVFTFFNPGKLAKGWKVQAMTVISNGNGLWHYMHKPQGKNSLFTVIQASKTSGAAFDLELKLKDIVLVGPAGSKSWKQALQ